MSALTWRRLERNAADVAGVWSVYLAADDYAMNVTGMPPDRDDSAEFFDSLAPELTEADTLRLGIFESKKMIGCAHLSRGWPDAHTAHIGLLLLVPQARGRGVGRRTVEYIESLAAQWPGIARLRLTVVEANEHLARAFWERMGYRASGAVTPFELMERSSVSHEFVKPLEAHL